MNKLPLKIRAMILNLLCEASSMRSIAKLTGVSFNTVIAEIAGLFTLARKSAENRYFVQ